MKKESFPANRMNILMQNVARIALWGAISSVNFYSGKCGLDLTRSATLGRKYHLSLCQTSPLVLYLPVAWGAKAALLERRFDFLHYTSTVSPEYCSHLSPLLARPCSCTDVVFCLSRTWLMSQTACPFVRSRPAQVTRKRGGNQDGERNRSAREERSDEEVE